MALQLLLLSTLTLSLVQHGSGAPQSYETSAGSSGTARELSGTRECDQCEGQWTGEATGQLMQSTGALGRLRVIADHLKSAQDTVSPDKTPAAMASSPLTSHVLDTSVGRPASGLRVTLMRLQGEAWVALNVVETNADGRSPGLIPGSLFTPDTYKLRFDTKEYFQKRAVETFYPYVEVVFQVRRPTEHHHVPLILSPHGYSTYRGS